MNLDGSDRDSFRPGIKGLQGPFPAPLPSVNLETVKAEAGIFNLSSVEPNHAVLDSQGRREDRKEMEKGGDPELIASSRKRRKGRKGRNSNVEDAAGEDEGDEGEEDVDFEEAEEPGGYKGAGTRACA